jgi:tetratricopeptide (TPR) repeat protein
MSSLNKGIFQWLFLKKKRWTIGAIILIFLLSVSFVFFKKAFESPIETPIEKDFVEETFEKIEKELKASRQDEAKKLFAQLAQKYSRNTFVRESSWAELNMENYPYHLYLLGKDYIGFYSRGKAPQKGIRILKKLIKEYPQSIFPDYKEPLVASAYIKIAEALTDIDPLESIKIYKRVIDKYRVKRADFTPYGVFLIEPLALLEIGYLYESKIKDYQKAISFYRQIVEKYPEYFTSPFDCPATTAQLRIVRIYRKPLRDYNGAIKEAERLLSMGDNGFWDPTEERAFDCGQSKAEAYCKIGEIYQEMGQHSDAINYFKKVIDAYPDLLYGYFESEAAGTYGQRAVQDLRISGIKAFGTKWTLTELENIERSHRNEGTRAYAFLTIASIYGEELTKIDRAIELYKEVPQKYPKQGIIIEMSKERIFPLVHRKMFGNEERK